MQIRTLSITVILSLLLSAMGSYSLLADPKPGKAQSRRSVVKIYGNPSYTNYVQGRGYANTRVTPTGTLIAYPVGQNSRPFSAPANLYMVDYRGANNARNTDVSTSLAQLPFINIGVGGGRR